MAVPTARFLFANLMNNIAQAELDFPVDEPSTNDTTAAPTQA